MCIAGIRQKAFFPFPALIAVTVGAEMYDRLRLLCRDGFIESLDVVGLNTRVYAITDFGRLSASIHFKMEFPERPSEKLAIHQIRLAEVCDALIVLGLIDPKSLVVGPKIKFEKGAHRADAIAKTLDGERVAIEFDRVAKASDRIRKVLSHYYRATFKSADFDGFKKVFFVTESYIFSKYKKMAAEVAGGSNDRIDVLSIDELLRSIDYS